MSDNWVNWWIGTLIFSGGVWIWAKWQEDRRRKAHEKHIQESERILKEHGHA